MFHLIFQTIKKKSSDNKRQFLQKNKNIPEMVNKLIDIETVINYNAFKKNEYSFL